MKFSAPVLAAVASMYTSVEGYSLWGPTTFFEPSFSTLAPMRKRQRALTRSFDDSFKQFDDTFRQLSPQYEIANNNEQLRISMDLPGVKIEDCDVSVEDGGKVLTIRGRRRARTDESSFTSKFSQSFSLDPMIDVDNMSANLMDGVLTVTAPKDMKRLEENIKSIPISPSAPPKFEAPQLSATSEEQEEVGVEAPAAVEEHDEAKVETSAAVEDGDEVVDLDSAEEVVAKDTSDDGDDHKAEKDADTDKEL
ncbi:kDa class I heat shock protein [Seminavis robusta]|uniref:KDa class I heat shock protein n=1 Tax=Seminavis robusta TaxID=568900 RepID=A0A9N8E1Q9_9STRA|nr:kDa class I heat shock protein [Seminavis robusta]|eukprot:Sro559_g166570.1 kDa class I heat shock protein (251) ;mRNA; f:57512-58264